MCIHACIYIVIYQFLSDFTLLDGLKKLKIRSQKVWSEIRNRGKKNACIFEIRLVCIFPLIYHSKAASPYQGATHNWNPPKTHQAATEEPARSHRGTHFWLHGPQGMLKKELKGQEFPM